MVIVVKVKWYNDRGYRRRVLDHYDGYLMVLSTGMLSGTMMVTSNNITGMLIGTKTARIKGYRGVTW